MKPGDHSRWIGKVGRVSNFRLERIIFAEARLLRAMGHLSGLPPEAGKNRPLRARCRTPRV